MAKIINVTHLGSVPRTFSHPFPVKNIGHVRLNNDAYNGCHSHNIEFCIRLKSSAEYAEDQVGETTFKTPFPHVFIKQPPQIHTYSYSAYREAFFIIYPSTLKAALQAFGFPLDKQAVSFAMSPKIASLIQQITDLLEETDVAGVVDEIDCLAQSLLVTVFNSQKPAENTTEPTPELIRLQKASSYLKTHYTEPISLDAIARRFGFSRRNFYRLWKLHFTSTPGQFLLKLKLDEACRLLENRSLSVKEIAEQLNFVDSTYFIATFKKHLLQTPLSYRNKMFR